MLSPVDRAVVVDLRLCLQHVVHEILQIRLCPVLVPGGNHVMSVFRRVFTVSLTGQDSVTDHFRKFDQLTGHDQLNNEYLA